MKKTKKFVYGTKFFSLFFEYNLIGLRKENEEMKIFFLQTWNYYLNFEANEGEV